MGGTSSHRAETRGWLLPGDVSAIARNILHGPPPVRCEGTPEEARAAGEQARRKTADRVAAPYWSWDLQRAFFAGCNAVDAQEHTA